MADDYTYHVFLSYKHHQLIVPWVTKFEERVRYWLTQELGGESAEVFFDGKSIDIGDRWPDKLQEGLKTSACMIGVWSPDYFQSRWCLSEWRSFLERERRARAGAEGLVVPVTFHDGDWFPDEARAVKPLDLSYYASTLPSFWGSPRALELEERLRELCKSVAKVVRRAPAFEDWPVVEIEPDPPPTVRLRRL